jgi:hypothetical protein
MLEVFALHSDADIKMVVYSPRVSTETRAILRGYGLAHLQRRVYRSQPMATPIIASVREQAVLIPALRAPHLDLIRRAAGQVRSMSPFARFHSPGVVEYLGSIGYSLQA